MSHQFHTRITTLRALTGAAVAAAAVAAAIPTSAQAAVACNETALVAAINAANAAGGGNVVLTPLCTYNMTMSHGSAANGQEALPVITTVVTLTGDQNLITRSNALSTLPFRIAEVSPTGKLTVKLTTLNNGRAVGAGGGILNFGAVTLTGSGLTNNTATTTGGGISNVDTPAPATAPAATFTSSTVSDNTASGRGGGVYNGLRSTLTSTSTSIRGNISSLAQGGGIAAVNSTATTLTSTPVTINSAVGAGGIFRLGLGAMTITSSPITFNTPNNCVGSVPAVPSCTA
jgi:hypothetical protein